MKVSLAYTLFLLTVFFSHAYSSDFKHYTIPLSLILLTFIFAKRVHFSLNLKHALFALRISSLILPPALLITHILLINLEGLSQGTHKLTIPSTNTLLYMLFLVSIPEEFFFRGFILDSLGKDWKANTVTSVLFSLAHTPRLFFYGDYFSILTFFPSLVMGWLYIKTQNTLAPIIFHFLSNLLLILFLQKLW